MNNNKKLKIESEVLKKLLTHLQNRTDVQNIDLMNLSGFCRNCLSKWYTEAAHENGVELNKEDAKFIHEIKKISDHSEVGEVSEFNNIPETSTIWPFVTSTKDNCLGQECEFFKSCFVVKARKKAIASEVVIVNHHLFFADFVLKDLNSWWI